MKKFILSSVIALGITGVAAAQQTGDYTNRKGENVQVDRNVQNGNGTVDKTYTAPNGNTATTSKSITTSGGERTVDKTVTGSKGNTYTATDTVRPHTVTRTQTGPNGKTHTKTRLRR